jgi:hypothetical protein
VPAIARARHRFVDHLDKAPANKALISRWTVSIILFITNIGAVGDDAEGGICAVRLDAGHRRIDRMGCRLISRAPDAALVLDEPVEVVWAQSTNAVAPGDCACILVQHGGGWRRDAPATPNDLAPLVREVRAALLALPRF